ncbi:uncharacterized protein PHACADRAFT_247528 [Phanerochaete carnosa HHB-10118-sp]|uniref:Uncharacterized protein n=1 Tax=Phanerochaete carnosa (strain HHB-10118-sp) TaxID=650164 RepID=K5VDS4_PHACS|nr:uncharacterized protein PHACADRAFT_247528 [Phanerochaete carnosa HHB-10118-sp]EKM61136.1 hypothetical protein PHACADRAFT_247528 [Phanerochaete carnosa HHB-10118-sp]
MLRDHQSAWRDLNWTSEKIIPMMQGGLWELYGGVLAQSSMPRDVLHFTRLPSQIKGIEEKQWEVQLPVPIRDFAMDPSQDLLIAIGTPNDNGLYRVHVLELSSGQKHPNTTSSGVIDHSAGGMDFSFAIQIAGLFIGVMFISHGVHENQLLIWNWKTGITELSLHGREISSFGFLTDHHVLLAVVDNPLIDPDEEGFSKPPLVVVDFTARSKEPTSLKNLEYECAFDFPPMLPTASVIAAFVRSDPAPNWTPSPELKVPFYTARRDRLFVITIWVAEGADITALLLLVPTSTIVAKLNSLPSDERGRCFEWEDWGPAGAHLRQAPHEHSMVWVCFVFGSSFIAPFRPGDPEALLPPAGSKMVQILDFNQLTIKRLVAESVAVESEVSHVIARPSTLILNRIFSSRVVTSLPYRRLTKKVPRHLIRPFGSAMLSEDAIITVASSPAVRQYRVLSF